jgi:hypothetical protein
MSQTLSPRKARAPLLQRSLLLKRSQGVPVRNSPTTMSSLWGEPSSSRLTSNVKRLPPREDPVGPPRYSKAPQGAFGLPLVPPRAGREPEGAVEADKNPSAAPVLPGSLKKKAKVPSEKLRGSYVLSEHCVVALDKDQHSVVREVFPHVRTRAIDLNQHYENASYTARLPSRLWPSIAGKGAWPNHPTFLENLAMIRRGKSPSLDPEPVAFNAVPLGLYNSNELLCKNIVAHEIVGLRSDVPVPRKYLGHFRVSRGFLILTARHVLPIGLARFLSGCWKTRPYDVWTRRGQFLRTFLKKVPAAIFNSSQEEMYLSGSESDSESVW